MRTLVSSFTASSCSSVLHLRRLGAAKLIGHGFTKSNKGAEFWAGACAELRNQGRHAVVVTTVSTAAQRRAERTTPADRSPFRQWLARFDGDPSIWLFGTLYGRCSARYACFVEPFSVPTTLGRGGATLRPIQPQWGSGITWIDRTPTPPPWPGFVGCGQVRQGLVGSSLALSRHWGLDIANPDRRETTQIVVLAKGTNAGRPASAQHRKQGMKGT